MQINEFIEASNRMERYYDKEYTSEQRQIMYEELKDWNINRYRKAVSIAIRNCKFLPKLAVLFFTENCSDLLLRLELQFL